MSTTTAKNLALRAAHVASRRPHPHPLARDVVAAAATLGLTLTARQGAAALREIQAIREVRAARHLLAQSLEVDSRPGAWRRTLGRLLEVLAGAYEAALPEYAGGTTCHLQVGRQPAASLTTTKAWADYARSRHEQTSGVVTLTITGRLLRALRRDQVPAVLGGVAHLDAQRTRGGWRVLCQTIAKGRRDGRQDAPTWQCLATVGGHTCHGATVAEATATAIAWQAAAAKRAELDAQASAQQLADLRRTDRMRYLAARILRRGRCPACWGRLLVAREDAQAVGACRAGTDAWLGRGGIDTTVAALPLRVVARSAAKRAGDQIALVVSIVRHALGRQVGAH